MMTLDGFYTFLTIMTAIAAVVFVVLFFVDAGYGKFLNPKFGPTIPNRIGWVLMECPVFIAMTIVWLLSERTWEVMPLVFFVIFQTHYFQRSFIFPMLIRGNGRIPISIMLMGATFNTLNALMQGGWIFHFGAMVNPAMYDISWLWSWQFIVGTLMWAAGFFVNLQSDYIIRHLRKPGDTRHYIPRGGMFRYVSSANYFGEFMEWVGYAIASWSVAGVVFAWWTFANLAPRAGDLRKRYEDEFGEEFKSLKRKRIIPFIY